MYYVNYGRWCGEVIGPFESEDVAQAYADISTARDPKVVGVCPPSVDKLAAAEERCKRTFYVTLKRTDVRTDTGRIKLVVVASSEFAAGTEALKQMTNARAAGVWCTDDIREV